MPQKKINKFLLKISGELFSHKGEAISMPAVLQVAKEIKTLKQKRNKIAVVVGAGNIIRGRDIPPKFDRVTVDYAGMTAAVVNGLVLKAALESINCPALVDSTLTIGSLGGSHQFAKVKSAFDDGKVVIMGGTGLPFVSTDTAAVIFALELGAQLVLKATKVNGVYDRDPLKSIQAKRFRKISFAEVISRRLEVMDQAAFVLAAKYNLPIRVFKWQRGVLGQIAQAKEVGTLVS